MRLNAPSLICFLAVLSAGCGLVDSLPSRDARCDLRPAEDQCTDIREFKGPSFVTFQGVCSTLTAAIGGGTYTEDARCDMTGVIAGCRTHNGDGSEQTNWFYAGEDYQTESDVREECDSGMVLQAPEP
jgi:hypothetical protein